MSKLLRIRDYILLASALAGEIFDEVRLVGGIAPDLMKARYGFVPPNFKRGSYFSTVSKMLSTGDINKVVGKDGKTYLELTGTGREKFKRRFPIASVAGKKWDGFFMQVIFDIPEKERVTRDLLRNKLKELGFGMLQESVWISPYHFEEDLREFVVNNSLGEMVYILEAKTIRAGDFKALAERIWKLDELRTSYEGVVEKSGELVQERDKKYFEKVKEVWELYFSALKRDPNLPEELLLKSVNRERALDMLLKIEN